MKRTRFWETAILSLLMGLVLLFCVGCAAKEAGGFTYENEELGFSLTVPVLPEDKMTISQEDRENGVHAVYMLYQGETGQANIVVLEEMSAETWKAYQEEGGPLPQELAASDQGRVLVWYPLQSNPYEAGTADADAVDLFVSESSIVTESFQFLQ